MIDVRDLTKWYGPTLAVDRLSFAVPAGQIVGFLGPNGAGKTTTLRILTGCTPMSGGGASVAGHDVLTQSQAARRQIGYLPESTPLYPEMRVEEYLHFRGRLFEMSRADRRRRIDALSDRCGLGQIRRRLIGQLSKGNRQRVGLAQALLHQPPVIILDEPTSGLDPNQITQFRELVRELRGQHTVILSTHILPEVEKTADRLLMLSRGRLVMDGTPAELRAGSGVLVVEVKAAQAAAAGAVRAVAGVASVDAEMRDGWCCLRVGGATGMDLREPIGALMLRNGWPIRELRHEASSLEQLFVELTVQQEQAVAG